MNPMRVGSIFLVLSICGFATAAPAQEPGGPAESEDPARRVVERAVAAMGGEAYLGMERTASRGRYFIFRRGGKGFTRFSDWTMYRPHVKWRFQLGKGDRSSTRVIDLELGKGWLLEGKDSVEELPEEEVEEFRRSVKLDLDVLLRDRLDEEGMSLFYYGPDEVAGRGDFEAVEFVDSSNNGAVVFFDRSSHRPAKMEWYFRDKNGLRHKEETEYSNWHTIRGVTLPLRIDVYVDDEISSQRFVEEMEVNPKFPEGVFEPRRLDD